MAARGWAWAAALAWLVLLAWLPWWLGLPLLLALAAVALVAGERLGDLVPRLRGALRWGLPGMLFALQRALGGDAFAWGAALLGALAGYTLLAGLEAWLDRDRRRAPPAPVAEWSELALAPVGPPAAVIELEPPAWSDTGECADPRGGRARWHADGRDRGRFELVDGTVADLSPRACFSPDGRWFAACLPRGRGVFLRDRDRARQWRLRGWALCGWAGEPWLIRGEGPPLALREVEGERVA